MRTPLREPEDDAEYDDPIGRLASKVAREHAAGPLARQSYVSTGAPSLPLQQPSCRLLRSIPAPSLAPPTPHACTGTHTQHGTHAPSHPAHGRETAVCAQALATLALRGAAPQRRGTHRCSSAAHELERQRTWPVTADALACLGDAAASCACGRFRQRRPQARAHTHSPAAVTLKWTGVRWLGRGTVRRCRGADHSHALSGPSFEDSTVHAEASDVSWSA